MAETDVSSLSQGKETDIPALKLGESGFNGLRVVAGIPWEECQRELQFPQSIQTFKKMKKDGTISPALSSKEMKIARAIWDLEIPKGYEDELKDKTEFVRQNMNDMDHSWLSFIKQAATFNTYGFSVIEKVYRKRLKSNGSKYNDGLIGLKKLPLRSQDSIIGWEWTNQGRDLDAVWQAVTKPAGYQQSSYMSVDQTYGEKVKIPRKKFMLFRNGNDKDSPLGVSPLVGAWESWKYKKSLENIEAQGISQDMQGFKTLYIPPRYMSPDVTPEDALVFEYYQKMIKNMHVGQQSGAIFPLVLDENGNKMFEFKIESVVGTKAYDSTKIIGRYALEILTALGEDGLVLGQNGGGSFALSDNKMAASDIDVESKLMEIQDQLNHDLIPQLFAVNGWSTEVLPKFVFKAVNKPDLDILSKWVQRNAAAGLIPQTQDTVEWLCEQAGMPYVIPEDMTREEFLTHMTAYDSNAGQGTGNGGTATSPSGTDTSTSNKENP